MKTKLLIFIALLQVNLVSAQTSQEKEIRVSVGETVEDSLFQGSAHSYIVELDSAQFVFGEVDQQSVDVAISVLDPDDKQVAAFDSPARGREIFQFNTESTGEFKIKVTPFEEEEGLYAFTLVSVEDVAEDPAERVDQLMRAYDRDDVPGGGVLVIEDGEIILEEYYGMANLTHSIPFNENTRNNIGSTSKQFTAFAISLLAEEGKLSLDDDIRDYIPELPQFGEDTVTIRNLLTHTSGYREFLNLISMTGQDVSNPVDTDKLIEIVNRQPELQNKPGTEWNYNNTGFSLMPLVVERVTDMEFPDWMEANVFKPLQMNNTMSRKNQYKVVPNASQGYRDDEDGGFVERMDLGGGMGASAIYTTLGDLSKWISNLNSPQVGNEDIIEEMSTPFMLKDSSSTGYGLGLFVQDYKGLKMLSHGGADVAHRSMLIYFPEINSAVVTQSNYGSFRGDIPTKVADIYFEDYYETEEDSSDVKEEAAPFEYDYEEFDALTGRYELVAVPGFILTFTRDGNELLTQATGQPQIELQATSDSTFSLIGVEADITFHRNENGTADSLTLHQNGNHIAKRIKWQPETLEEFTGNYFSNELQTQYELVVEDSNLVLQHYFVEDLKLEPGKEDTFSSGYPMREVSFIRNKDGEVTAFTASNGRTRGVLFEKDYIK